MVLLRLFDYFEIKVGCSSWLYGMYICIHILETNNNTITFIRKSSTSRVIGSICFSTAALDQRTLRNSPFY